MTTMHEIAVPLTAQLNLDSTVINQETVWEEWVEKMEMHFMVMNIGKTKKRVFLLYYGGADIRELLDDGNLT